MPEKEGIRYHVISMQWINKWKIYVDYDKQFGSKEESKTNDMQAAKEA
jgi:hypothetical protein